MTQNPVLNSPNFEKLLLLQIDASNRDVGAALGEKTTMKMDIPSALVIVSNTLPSIHCTN